MIYEVNMSKGLKLKIDEEDYNKIVKNISANLIQVKLGTINPSFIISIIPIEEDDTYQKKIYKKILDENGNIKIIEDGYKTVKKIIAGVNKEAEKPLTKLSVHSEIRL